MIILQANLALAQKIGYSTTTIWGVNWVGVDPATGSDLVRKNGQIYDQPLTIVYLPMQTGSQLAIHSQKHLEVLVIDFH